VIKTRKKEKNRCRESEKDREIQNVSLNKKRQITRFGEVTSTLFNWKVMSQRWMLERTLEGKTDSRSRVRKKIRGVCFVKRQVA